MDRPLQALGALWVVLVGDRPLCRLTRARLPGRRELLDGWGGTAPSRAHVVTPAQRRATRGALFGAAPARGRRRPRSRPRRTATPPRTPAAWCSTPPRSRGSSPSTSSAASSPSRAGTSLQDRSCSGWCPAGWFLHHARDAPRHRRRCDRERHPRQGPPPSTARSATTCCSITLLTGGGETLTVTPDGTPDDLLGDRRRHGAHRHDPRRDVRAHPGGDPLHPRRGGALPRPRRDARDDGGERRRRTTTRSPGSTAARAAGRLGRGILGHGDHARLDGPPEVEARSCARLHPTVLRAGAARDAERPRELHGPCARSTSSGSARPGSSHRGSIQDLGIFFHPLDMVDGWKTVYGRRGFVQYQIVVPFGREMALRHVGRDAQQREPPVVPRGAEALRRVEPGDAVVPDAGLDPGRRHPGRSSRPPGDLRSDGRRRARGRRPGVPRQGRPDAPREPRPSCIRGSPSGRRSGTKLDPEGVVTSDLARRLGL